MKPLLLTLALALTLPAAALHAQEPASQQYVFHAYSNLIQIPVLTLTQHRRAIPSGTPLPFAVSIDGGPPFLVHHVRLEDGDPISLSIVLDVSGNQKRLIDALDETAIDETIANWVQQSLQPVDHVSVYAVDCRLVRTAADIPADGNALTRAIDAAIHSTPVHQADPARPGCITNTNALTYVVNQLSKLHGHRVVLAIGRGKLRTGSASDAPQRGPDWRTLTDLASMDSVTVFGLEERDIFTANYNAWEDPFNILCQRSGGFVLGTNPEDVPQELQHFITVVRDRYIVEFPRPNSLSTGLHVLNVTLADAKSPYFIRPSGASFPAAKPSVLADPTTVPMDPSQAPAVGSRRILRPTQ
jgi:hypothetical protein